MPRPTPIKEDRSPPASAASEPRLSRLGAILVIAVFYTEQIGFGSLAVGGILFAVSIGANLAGLRGTLPFFILGAATWLAFLQSGVHATLAAVLIALTIPARTEVDSALFRTRMVGLLDRLRATRPGNGGRLLTKDEQNILHMETTIGQATAPLQQLEHALMPMVTFVVISGGILRPTTWEEPALGTANA